MNAEPEVDVDRVPFETRRALEENGYFVEMMEAGLSMRRRDDGDLDVIDCHGETLAAVPLHRLLALDPERLRVATAAALERMPTGLADQVVAAINDGEFVLSDPPDDEVVRLDVPLGDRQVVGVFVAHRRVLVPGWPEDGPA